MVVFDYPCDTSIKYIKRLIGLPGDEIIYQDKQLTVNGISVKSKYESVYKNPKQYGSHVYLEILDDRDHNLLLTPSRRGREGTFTVPEGHYYFMGDNRDNSVDSRYECPGLYPEITLSVQPPEYGLIGILALFLSGIELAIRLSN